MEPVVVEETFGGGSVEVLVGIEESVDERVLLGDELVVPILSLDVGLLHVFQNGRELVTHVIVGFREHVGIVRVFLVEVFYGLFCEIERLVHCRYTNIERNVYVDIV
jgi:hypothetical protein